MFFGTLWTELTYLPVARSIALDIPEVETPDWRRLCPYLILSSPSLIILSPNSPLPNILSSANTLAFLRLNDMTCDQPPRDRIHPPSQLRTPSLLTDHRVFWSRPLISPRSRRWGAVEYLSSCTAQAGTGNTEGRCFRIPRNAGWGALNGFRLRDVGAKRAQIRPNLYQLPRSEAPDGSASGGRVLAVGIQATVRALDRYNPNHRDWRLCLLRGF
jgi:hypothetical protein